MNRDSKARTQDQNLRRLVPPLLDWFAKHARDLPWRRTRDAYAVWVSEVMLQQTQVATVIPYWSRWMRDLPTIESVARAAPGRLHKLWEGLGYYTRVRNLQEAAQRICSDHGGQFPRRFEDILALPGIGRYTAGAIASIAFDQPAPILDGNVIRVFTRLFGIRQNPRDRKTSERLWRLADQLVHQASRVANHPSPSSHFNQSLMELGALVCTPRSPKCGDCPVAAHCVALRLGCVGKLPRVAKRQHPTARQFVAFVAHRNGRWLVRQRPAGVVNAHLWEFPNVEITSRRSGIKTLARHALGCAPGSLELLCVIRHVITRHRITLQTCRVTLRARPSPNAGVWLASAQLRPLAFTSAHKKVLNLVNGQDSQPSHGKTG